MIKMLSQARLAFPFLTAKPVCRFRVKVLQKRPKI